MSKRIGIYDPYLDTLGGGERYCLTVAEILLQNNYSVDLFWSGKRDLIDKAEKRFSLELNSINLVPDVFHFSPHKIDLIEDKDVLSNVSSRQIDSPGFFSKIQNFLDKFQITKQYDAFFYLSDGSLPFLFSKKNFIHVQVPFLDQFNFFEKVSNYFKLKLVSKIICNSNFTQKFTKRIFNSNIQVIYPPVDVEKFTPNKSKENIILSVGRFDNILNAKKQDVLIEAFRAVVQRNKTKNWKFILAGGSLEEPSKNAYLQHLQYKAKDLPIEFVVNPDFTKLKDIYSRSKIYWHAAGFEVDEELYPQNTEHFGITIVEAMASGLVPVVVAKGGLPEIIENSQNGFLWNTIDELISKTQLLIASPDLLNQISKEAIERSSRFSKKNFEKQFLFLLNK